LFFLLSIFLFIIYKVYIYREIKPSKFGTNLTMKICFCFSTLAQNRAPILSLRAPIFVETEVSKLSKKSGPDFAKSADDFGRFWNVNFESKNNIFVIKTIMDIVSSMSWNLVIFEWEKCYDVSSVIYSTTLKWRVMVEKHISEKTAFLKYWMKMWYHSHLNYCFLSNGSIHNSVDSPRYPNASVAQFPFVGKLKWFLLVDHGCGESHTWSRDVKYQVSQGSTLNARVDVKQHISDMTFITSMNDLG